jgi:hypothetical protein
MNRKLEIEARLERSLRNQVKAPRLARAFDAGVWARIEAERARRRAPAAAVPRWLFVLNVVGVGAAIVVALVFGAPLLASAESAVSLPQVSVAPGVAERLAGYAIHAITFGSIAFGLMFTSLGRRLRSELREMM